MELRNDAEQCGVSAEMHIIFEVQFRSLVPVFGAAYNTLLDAEVSEPKKGKYNMLKDTHESSLIVDGLPNCVAEDRSRLKQIIHTRVRLSSSRSCVSEIGLIDEAW